MRIALFLTPASDHFLQLASQIGVTDLVMPYPGLDLNPLLEQCQRVSKFGLKISVIERHVPHDKVVHARSGRDEQIEDIKTLIQNMGEAGIETLCYNWMPDEDWMRTSFEAAERGGALVSSFDIEKQPVTPMDQGETTSANELWSNLEYFLKAILPTAERSGVNLALHPDDPPLPSLRGQDRIICSIEALEKAVTLVPSPSNGICFCQGTMAMADIDIDNGIQQLAPYIKFVHFRDIKGTAEHFQETFHDNGKTDMVSAMRTYLQTGFSGPMRPDHVPTLDGETNENPGYEMMGRLYAVGYMKGIMQAIGA